MWRAVELKPSAPRHIALPLSRQAFQPPPRARRMAVATLAGRDCEFSRAPPAWSPSSHLEEDIVTLSSPSTMNRRSWVSPDSEDEEYAPSTPAPRHLSVQMRLSPRTPRVEDRRKPRFSRRWIRRRSAQCSGLMGVGEKVLVRSRVRRRNLHSSGCSVKRPSCTSTKEAARNVDPVDLPLKPANGSRNQQAQEAKAVSVPHRRGSIRSPCRHPRWRDHPAGAGAASDSVRTTPPSARHRPTCAGPPAMTQTGPGVGPFAGAFVEEGPTIPTTPTTREWRCLSCVTRKRGAHALGPRS